MNRSAASSSSAVVTPGWHLERSMWRQRAWMAPAAAIWSICSGVLRMITEFEGRALELFFHPLRGQHGPDAVADLIGRRRAVDAAKDAALLVVGHQRLGLVVIGAEPVSDYLGLVVVADFEPRSVHVAHALVLGRVELHVEDVPLLDAHAAAAEAPNHLLVGNVHEDRRRQLAAQLAELRAERLGLRDGAGESVEDEPVGRLVAGHALRDDADHHLIGNEVAPIHVPLGLGAELGALTNGGPEDVAGRVVGEAEVLLQPLALRPLSGAGRTQKHEIELGHSSGSLESQHRTSDLTAGRRPDRVSGSALRPRPTHARSSVSCRCVNGSMWYPAIVRRLSFA